jgi:hypothetical protein
MKTTNINFKDLPPWYRKETYLSTKDRAEKAEARVKELEGILSLCYDTIGNMKDSELQEKNKTAGLERELCRYRIASTYPRGDL